MTEVTPEVSTERELGGCPVGHFDISPPRELGSHWQLGNELRESGPRMFNTQAQGYWVFTRHEQVREIYQRHEIFSSDSITPWDPDPGYRFIPTQINPPEHSKYRQLVSRWFAPNSVKAIEPMMRDLCRRLIADIAQRGSCDFVTEFAIRYPTEVFLTMLGLPASDADRMVPWVEDFFSGFGGDPDKLQAMMDGLGGIRQYWADAIEERRGEPEPREGDLASHLMHGLVDAKPLPDDEVLDILQVLVLAGLDTTRGQLGYLFQHLAANPDDRQRLIDEPALIPTAVEESVRIFTIVFGDGRKVTQDTEFLGCPLKKGDMVYGLVTGANRDPKVFDRPDEFVVDRKVNNHFGFAAGPHRCLGAHLARKEMQIAVEEWLRVIPDFRVDTDETLMERGGGSMLTLLALPLAWDQETAS
jgi:cytochrome P450